MVGVIQDGMNLDIRWKTPFQCLQFLFNMVNDIHGVGAGLFLDNNCYSWKIA